MKINSVPTLLLTLFLGLIVSALVGRFFYSVESQVIKAEFEKDVVTEGLSLERELSLNFHAINALGNFFDNSEVVDPDEFQQFTSRIIRYHPSLKALEWVPNIPHSERAKYDADAHYFGHALTITERDETGNLIPANNRPHYYPVTFLEPIRGNENAFGFDLASNEKRLAALNLAKETGNIAITASIQLVQTIQPQKSFLAVAPVYNKLDPKQIDGYIAAVFKIKQLIDNALASTAEHDIRLTLFDTTTETREILHISHPNIQDYDQTLSQQFSLGAIGGRQWLLEAMPAKAYILQKRTANPFIIFLLTLTFISSSIIYIYKLQKQSQITEQAVQARTVELNQAKEALERITLLDEMTGIANRRHFDDYFISEWNRGHREQTPLTLIVVDIDFFKQFNDNYGHLAGDSCIQQVAKGLDETVRRSTDLLARYGGEEFAIIAPNTADGFILAELCREHILELNIPHRYSKIADHITVSVGFATLIPSEESNPDKLFQMADQALYQAKSSGRNQSRAYSEIG